MVQPLVVVSLVVALALLPACGSLNRAPAGSGQRPSTSIVGDAGRLAKPVAPGQFAGPRPELQPIGFDQLTGWSEDALEEAWPAWRQSCRRLISQGQPHRRLCEAARALGDQPSRQQVRQYFEANFQPHLAAHSSSRERSGLITGYYEPVLSGARSPSARFAWPIYRSPPMLRQASTDSPGPTRRALEESGVLKGHELFYLEDPIEAFFLQVQGSGRIVLAEGPEAGKTVRVGFASKNGQPYVSIGRWLIEQKALRPGEASMQGIKAWAARNPSRVQALLWQNPSMVFFRELGPELSALDGPLGALGLPLLAGRSIAVDPREVPLGLPVFLQASLVGGGEPGAFADGLKASNRLVMAQDTGTAITGPNRADFYFGSGDMSGEQAGRQTGRGRLVLLLPKD